jgi:hypothetical protein
MTLPPSYRRILHRMGYYNYQQGLIYRHMNQEGGWNSHLMNCRNFILKAFDLIRPSVITVLGSGWLLDLPLREIGDRVGVINLVDIVHPPEVKNQVAELKNVILREEDVTGGLISDVWQKAGRRTFLNKLRSLDEIEIPEYKPEFDPGMVVSLNIFTQLESMPLKLLSKKSAGDDKRFIRFRREIQQNHLTFLRKHDSVLITDLSEVVTESSGRIDEIMSVLVDLPHARLKEEWTWNYDLKRSDYYRKRSVFKVAAILLDNET